MPSPSNLPAREVLRFVSRQAGSRRQFRTRAKAFHSKKMNREYLLRLIIIILAVIGGFFFGHFMLEPRKDSPVENCRQITLFYPDGTKETFKNIQASRIAHSDLRFDFYLESGELIAYRGDLLVRDCR